MANIKLTKLFTDIADAIREKNTGKIITNENIIETKVSKTSNATGFDSYNGSYGTNLSKTDTVTIPGATKIKVKIAYQTENTSYDYVTITPGVGDATNKLGNSTLITKEFEFPGTDTVAFYFKSDQSNGNYLGYYAEVTGIQEEEIDLGTIKYVPTEMAEAIKALEGSGAISIPEIEWHYVIGDSTFLSDLKTHVENLDDLVCLVAAPGVSTSGYPFIYTKGDNSYDGDILYCSVFTNNKWNGYAVGETTTTINLSTGEVKRVNSSVSYGTYFQRYVYGVQKVSINNGGGESSTGGETPATFDIVTFTTEIPSSQTITDTFPVPEEHKTTLTSVSQLISVEGYWYDEDSYYTYSYIPQRVLQFKTSKRLERCPNGEWDTNINASTTLSLSSGKIGTSDRTGWAKGYPIKVTYMVTK